MNKLIIGYAIGPIGTGLLGFITLPLLTWFYSAEDIGRVAMLQVAASFMTLLFCLGLDQAYTREYHETEKKPQLFLISIFPGLFLILFFFIFLLSIGNNEISEWLYGIRSNELTIITILFFLLSFLSRFLSLILRMEEKSFLYSISQIFPKIIFLGAVILSVFLGGGSDISKLLLFNVISILTTFVCLLFFTRKTWVSSIYQGFDFDQFIKIFKFGVPLIFGGLASWGLSVVDKVFLRTFSTYDELGVYSVTLSLVAGVTIFTSIFNTIWSPLVYKWVVKGVDIKKIEEISRHALAVFYFIVVFCGLFGWVPLVFLPEKYENIKYLLTICILGPLIYCLSETTGIGISISKKTFYSMLSSITAFVFNVVACYFLIPKYGALGAAVSNAISFFLFYIIKTEFSALVGYPVCRVKSYIIIGAIIIFVVIVGLNPSYYFYFIPIWVGFMIFGFFEFRESVVIFLSWMNINVDKA